MMKRFLFASLVAALLVATQVCAAGLDQFFNSANYIKYKGAEFTIGNIRIGDSSYWIKWSMQEDLSFRITDYGKINDTDFVDLKKLCFANGAQKVTREEVESYGFDTTGCESFSKKPTGAYCCESNNAYRVLGEVLQTSNGTLVIRYTGFVLPRYMAEGTLHTCLVNFVNSKGQSGYFLYTIYFDKVNMNGKTCWREIKSFFNSFGKAGGKIYFFDPETYEPCGE